MNTNNEQTKRGVLKLPLAYWAIYEGKEVMYQGTHTDCWTKLLAMYSQHTVAQLAELDVRIARVN